MPTPLRTAHGGFVFVRVGSVAVEDSTNALQQNPHIGGGASEKTGNAGIDLFMLYKSLWLYSVPFGTTTQLCDSSRTGTIHGCPSNTHHTFKTSR